MIVKMAYAHGGLLTLVETSASPTLILACSLSTFHSLPSNGDHGEQVHRPFKSRNQSANEEARSGAGVTYHTTL